MIILIFGLSSKLLVLFMTFMSDFLYVPPSATSTGFLTAETQCPIFPSWQPRISPHIRLCIVTVPVT